MNPLLLFKSFDLVGKVMTIAAIVVLAYGGIKAYNWNQQRIGKAELQKRIDAADEKTKSLKEKNDEELEKKSIDELIDELGGKRL